MQTHLRRSAKSTLSSLSSRLTASIRRSCESMPESVTLNLGPAMAFAVASLVLVCLYPFVDQNYQINYQFDTQVFGQHVAQFRKALETGRLSALPTLESWPPYFDAYDVLLTVLTEATTVAGRVFSAIDQSLPTVEIQTNFWARWMSLAFHCVGMALLWLTLMRLYARPLVTLGLTTLVALAPTVIDMDLGRNDWGVLGSLCAVLYFNIRIVQGDLRRRVLIGLGVSAALIVTMKLNGPAFATLVVFSLFSIKFHRGNDIGRMGLLLVAFVIPVLVLSFRELYYLVDFLPNLMSQLADLARWSTKSPKPSWFYYSWDILESQGTVYRLLVWASVPVVLTSLARRPSLTGLFVFASFSTFLAWSLVVDYGFARGGYHLLPFFVMMMAAGFAQIEHSIRCVIGRPRLARQIAGITVAVLLTEPLLVVARNYAAAASLMFERTSAVSITRTLPAEWMAKVLPRGTRVATLLGNDISLLPPIHALGFVFDRSLFTASHDHFDLEPPSVSALRSTADVFIVTDYQRQQLLWDLNSLGRRDTASRWQRWFEMMRRDTPSVAFSAPRPGYYYRNLEIFVLAPASSAAALRASLPVIHSPVDVRGPLSGDLPEVREWLTLESAREHWQIETHQGSIASLQHSPNHPGEMRVSITRLTGVAWHVKLNQMSFEIRGNQPYMLTFRARASQPRRIACAVGENGPPWRPVGLYEELDLTTDWRTYAYPFVGAMTELNARIYFDMGFSGVDVELADVVLRDVSAGRDLAAQ